MLQRSLKHPQITAGLRTCLTAREKQFMVNTLISDLVLFKPTASFIPGNICRTCSSTWKTQLFIFLAGFYISTGLWRANLSTCSSQQELAAHTRTLLPAFRGGLGNILHVVAVLWTDLQREGRKLRLETNLTPLVFLFLAGGIPVRLLWGCQQTQAPDVTFQAVSPEQLSCWC